jgi:DNA-binding CsgD family transcriptional regulator
MAREFLTIGGFATSKEIKKRHYETLEEREAREESLMEEAARPTGFDILMENKEKGLAAMRKLFKEEPALSRGQLALRLHISMRTVYRYMRIIREGQGIKTTAVDTLVAEKEKRKVKLIKLMKEHPEYPRSQLAVELGISRKTLYSYLDELGL